MKNIIKITPIILILLSFSFQLNAQNCARKAQKFCPEEQYGDYDYRSQSSYAVLAPGDTARASIVVYSKQDTRILICSDPALGDVNYKIFDPKRVTKRSIKEVNKTETEVPVYAKDASGNLLQEKDEWGDPMYDYDTGEPVYKIERYESIVEYDTIWQTERVIKEEIVFDSAKSDKNYWEELGTKKTKRLIIEVVVPQSDQSYEGCVNVEVGHKFSESKKTFYSY